MSTPTVGRRVVSVPECSVKSSPMAKPDVVRPPAVVGEDAWEMEFHLDKLTFNPPGEARPHATERADKLLNTEGGTVNLQELYLYEYSSKSQWIWHQDRPATDRDLDTWLRREIQVPSGSSIIGGLRMVVFDRTVDSFLESVILPRTEFESLMRSFQIPWCFAEVLSWTDPIFANFMPWDNQNYRFLYRTWLIPNYGIAISYDIETRVTSALIFGSGEGLKENQSLLESLHRHQRMAIHPLLLPVLAISLSTDRGRYMVNTCKDEAEKLERMTGQNPYSPAHVEIDDRDLPELRLDAITIIGKCVIHRSNTKSRVLCIEQARSHVDSIPCSDLSSSAGKQLLKAKFELRDLIGYVARKNEHLLNKVEHVQQQVETQLAVIDKLMAKSDFERNIRLAQDSREIAKSSKDIAEAAQRDSSVMRVVAAASKRDSSSMKVLAGLTMLFLPGTFLAALLNEPLAHWEIFVGATIGVTIAVFAIWVIWFYCYEIPKHRSEDFAAAEDLDDSCSPLSDGKGGNWKPGGNPFGRRWLRPLADA